MIPKRFGMLRGGLRDRWHPAVDIAQQLINWISLTRCFDIDAARAAPSFDKFWRDVETLLASQ